MKQYILALCLMGSISAAMAQDPQLSAPNVTPSPAKKNAPINVSFNFQNSSTLPVLNPDPDNNMTVIGISLNKIKPVLDANGVPAVSGPGAAFFTWMADCSGTCATDGSSDATDIWNITGIQSQDIPGQPDPFTTVGGPITIMGKVTAESTVAESNALNGSGFIANLTPGAGGDIDISPASNSLAAYTYTNGVLPVTLTSFTAVKENTTAVLSWATTEETNSDHFEIQHSTKGKEWSQIGSVASNGESTTLKNYTFSHSSPVTGENLYRLKMVDKDATFAYSRIQSMKFEGFDKDLSVYPNPTIDVLRIKDYSQVTNVSINDMNGRTVLESGVSTTGEISVRNLTSGMYLVKITRSNGSASSQKIVVVK